MRTFALAAASLACAAAVPTTIARVELEPGLVFSAPSWAAVRPCTSADSLSAMLMLRHDEATLTEMEALFWAVSDPTSSQYGDHLTQAQMADRFGPAAGAAEAVSGWLSAAGVEFSISGTGDIIEATMPAPVAARLFNTEFHQFKHTRTGHTVNRVVRAYTVPAEMAKHLDIVGDLVALPVKSFAISNESAAFNSSVLSNCADSQETVGVFQAIQAPVQAPEAEEAVSADAAADWPTDCDKGGIFHKCGGALQ